MIAGGRSVNLRAAAANASGSREISGATGSIREDVSSPGRVKPGSVIGSDAGVRRDASNHGSDTVGGALAMAVEGA